MEWVVMIGYFLSVYVATMHENDAHNTVWDLPFLQTSETAWQQDISHHLALPQGNSILVIAQSLTVDPFVNQSTGWGPEYKPVGPI